MFTGIVHAVGEIESQEERGGDVRLHIKARGLDLKRVSVGDSIAVNGCCLTVVEKHARGFSADVSHETLALTTLGALVNGSPVNLEPSLTLATPLGGHLVIGHVDGVATVKSRCEDARSVRFEIEAPVELARYIARKGSVCADGVSLTVNSVHDNIFDVNIIPHTLEHTILGHWQPGAHVNLEVDLLARYLERLLQRDTAAGDSK